MWPSRAKVPDKTQPAPKPLYCSFCAKSQHEVRKLIAGLKGFICDECVDHCAEIVFDSRIAARLAAAAFETIGTIQTESQEAETALSA